MLKQLGIAAACGVALYGLARYINNNFVVVIDSTGNFPDLLAPAPACLEEATDAGEPGTPSAAATDADARYRRIP